jgi:excisionase family DNA binding protein
MPQPKFRERDGPLDLEQVARELQCSVSTVRKLVRANVLSHYRYSPMGKIFVPLEALEEYKQARLEGVTA